MKSDKLPRYYVSAPNNDVGYAHIGDRECTVYGEPCNHDTVIMVCGQVQDGVNTAHRYAVELAAKLNGAAVATDAAPAPIAGPTQRQLYKAAALQCILAHPGTWGSITAQVKYAGMYANALLAEDEEHGKS